MFRLCLQRKVRSKREKGIRRPVADGFLKRTEFLFMKKEIIVRSQTGFTLIEMVIVIAMIGIITGATLKLVKFSDVYKNLTLKTAEIRGMLRNAQILALAPPVIKKNGNNLLICGFGLKSENTSGGSAVSVFYSYSISGEVSDCANIASINDVCDQVSNGCEDYETRHFVGFNVSDENDNNVKVFFRSPYGNVLGVSDNYEIIVKQLEPEYSKNIKINKFGKINEE